MLEKTVADAAQTSLKIVEAGLKKIWSVLDAAGERKTPGEMLSPKAVGAIQGKSPSG